jgi:23S rRNA (adenine2503-C2)-methyltransferase
VTISTVGLVPQIKRLAQEGLQVTLAISLHAATDEERQKLLPPARRWSLAELVDAARYYADQTGRRVTFEWALIQGRNDTPKQAHALGVLLSGLLSHVNLIPLNPTDEYAGQGSDLKRITRFQEILSDYGVPNTVRVRRGIDIQAGCGQLRQKAERAKS